MENREPEKSDMLDSSVTISLKEKPTLFSFGRESTLMVNLNPFTHA